MFTVRQKMFIARMMNRVVRLARRLVGRGMRTRCRRRGVMWDLDLDEGIDLSIYLLGAYEPAMLRAYTSVIHEGDVVFDIGANIGAHTLHFARLVGPAGRVFAFEPTDYAAAKIRLNLEINPDLARRVNFQQRFLVADNTEVLPATVAARWPVANDHDDLNEYHLGKPESLDHALAVTADDFFDAENLRRLDFVKIDVDGYEYPVLRGFHRNLERFRPRILIELAPFLYTAAQAGEFDDYVRFIAELGYSFIEARTGRPLPCDPTALRNQIKPGCTMNCLVLHPSS